jgi:hypothetical protein
MKIKQCEAKVTKHLFEMVSIDLSEFMPSIPILPGILISGQETNKLNKFITA